MKLFLQLKALKEIIKNKTMKIIFMGTPDIGVKSLEYLIGKENIEVCAVVTQPDKPSGRGQKLTPPPVKTIAANNNIKTLQPKKIRQDEEVIDFLKSINPDFLVTFAFGQILSQEVLDIPKLGTINLHASLLPKYRGANPIQWPIINGDKETGITTMFTELSLDAGPILLTEKIKIDENMTAGELYEIISEKSPELIYQTLIKLKNKEITPVIQDEKKATLARKIKKEDGKISWNQTAWQIHNLVRGTQPWPMAFCEFRNNIIKVIETRIDKTDKNLHNNVGEIIEISKKGIKVSTKQGCLIINKIQPQGKKPMDAYSWTNGARVETGDMFS